MSRSPIAAARRAAILFGATIAAGWMAAAQEPDASETSSDSLASVPLPSSEEGDLRNQTFVTTLGFARLEALVQLRAALKEGALRDAEASAALLLEGDPQELLALDERLFLSPREALPHVFATGDPALREARRHRDAARPSTPGRRPLERAEVDAIEQRAPGTPLALDTLMRAGDEQFFRGDALAAAAYYRRARLHLAPRTADATEDENSSAARALHARAAACAAWLEAPDAAREVAGYHGIEPSSPGPGGAEFEQWRKLLAAAPGLAAFETAPDQSPSGEPAFELEWSEALDPDRERRLLSENRGIRASGPRALETDLRPAFAANQVLIQDRRFVYRFESAGGRRLERIDLDRVLGGLQVSGADEDQPPYLGPLRRAPTAAGQNVVVVHDDRRGILLCLHLATESDRPASAKWAIAEGQLHRPGEPPLPLVAEGAEWPHFQPFPLLVGTRVFAAARFAHSGKERLELWCLDAASGEPLWRRFLCEGSPVRTTSSRSFRVSGGSLAPSAPIYSDGLVFLTTNLGVIAACDAADGSVAWLLKTARSDVAGPRWSTADPIPTCQGLFAAPSDADFFYALRRELPAAAAGAPDLFLLPPLPRGALEAHLVARGSRHYFYVRAPHWREVAELSLVEQQSDPGAPGAKHYVPQWRISGDTGSQEEELLFLPAFAADRFMLCTDRFLYAFDCERGFLATFRARTPLSPATAVPLPTRQVFGNVAAYRSGIVVVGSEGVSFWNRRS